jgi:Nucleotidyltransferase domain
MNGWLPPRIDGMDDAFIERVAAPVRQVSGIVALVLGGSRARGSHRPTSDYDFGLYVDADRFDIAALNRVAQMLDDQRRSELCTPMGGWGPWVTGGGWLLVEGQHVDFIYRDIARVARVVDECCAGVFSINDQAGHPAGFPSSIYMGEVAVCRSLWDPHGRLAMLKARTVPYPEALKQAVFRTLGWQPGFCLQLARATAGRGDSYYLHAQFVRAVTCLVQELFALNEQWLLNEKGSVALAAGFVRTPERLRERVDQLFAALPADPPGACDLLEALNRDVGALRA